jgi:PIN domain nuclease of toxin-antitoxin system
MPARTLLDTHTFLWFITGNERLSGRAREVLADREGAMLISVASLWEIAIKYGLGKLTLDRPFQALIPGELERQRIGTLGISPDHLSELVRLPLHHRDPFDRLIVAQALSEGVPVISVDPAFDPYGVQRIW